jgi:hypothetical protein
MRSMLFYMYQRRHCRNNYCAKWELMARQINMSCTEYCLRNTGHKQKNVNEPLSDYNRSSNALKDLGLRSPFLIDSGRNFNTTAYAIHYPIFGAFTMKSRKIAPVRFAVRLSTASQPRKTSSTELYQHQDARMRAKAYSSNVWRRIRPSQRINYPNFTVTITSISN